MCYNLLSEQGVLYCYRCNNVVGYHDISDPDYLTLYNVTKTSFNLAQTQTLPGDQFVFFNIAKNTHGERYIQVAPISFKEIYGVPDGLFIEVMDSDDEHEAEDEDEGVVHDLTEDVSDNEGDNGIAPEMVFAEPYQQDNYDAHNNIPNGNVNEQENAPLNNDAQLENFIDQNGYSSDDLNHLFHEDGQEIDFFRLLHDELIEEFFNSL